MNQKLRVGVVGIGYWGPNLARNFEEMSETQLVAVVDKRVERLTKLTERFPAVKPFQSVEELVEYGVDAVVIATPPATHFELAKYFLTRGIHVLVEKPITLASADAEVLIHLAEENNLVLMVGHTFEYNPAVRTIKDLIDRGDLGEVYYIDAVRVNLGIFQSDINVLWDLAPHDISIILYLLGKLPEQVAAFGGAFVLNDYGIHDLAYTHMKFADDTIANMRVSWLDPNKTRKITIVGRDKMLVYDDVGLEKIKVYDKSVLVEPDSDNYGTFQTNYRYGDVVTPHIAWQEPLRMECEHYADCIINGKQPLSDGHSGLRVVKIIEAANEALRTGQTVDLQWSFSKNGKSLPTFA